MLQISQIEFQMFWIVVYFENCAMPSFDKLEAIWKPCLQDMLRENPAAPCLFRIDNQMESPLMGLSGWWWSTWKYSELEIKPNHLWVASLWSWRTSPPHTQRHRCTAGGHKSDSFESKSDFVQYDLILTLVRDFLHHLHKWRWRGVKVTKPMMSFGGEC